MRLGISDDPSQPADPLSSATVDTPVALIGTLADAVPESLVATLDACVTHPEDSSYYIATEDSAEMLFFGTPIPSEAAEALKGRRFRRWHASTRWLWTAATLDDGFMAPIEEPSHHDIERSAWKLVGGGVGGAQDAFVPVVGIILFAVCINQTCGGIR